MPLASSETVHPVAHRQAGAPGSQLLPRRNRPELVVLAAVGVALALIGAVALGLAGLQRGEGGFFTTTSRTLSTSTSALVTDEVLVGEGRPGNSASDLGDLATVRVRAVAPANSKAVFLGIGPKADVEAYLRAVSHDRMTTFELDPFEVHYTRKSGGPALAPAAQPFWVASATGVGPQDLLWNKRRGAWSAVAMNADGSPGVAVTSDLGLRFEFLLPAGFTLLAAGGLLLVVAFRAGPSRRGLDHHGPDGGDLLPGR